MSCSVCHQSCRESDICPQTETTEWNISFTAKRPEHFNTEEFSKTEKRVICTLGQGLLVKCGLWQCRRFKLADVLRQSVLGGHKWVWQGREERKHSRSVWCLLHSTSFWYFWYRFTTRSHFIVSNGVRLARGYVVEIIVMQSVLRSIHY